MKSLKDIYSDQHYSVRSKVPILARASLVLILISVPVFILSFVFRRYETAVGFFLMSVLLSAAVVFLFKGNYRRASNLMLLGFLSALVFTTQFVTVVEQSKYELSGLVGCAVIVTSLLLAENPKLLALHASIAAANVFSLFARLLLTAESATGGWFREHLPEVIVILFVGAFAIVIRRMLDNLIAYSEGQLDASRKRQAELRNLASMASEKLMLAQQMEDLSLNTADSSVKIRTQSTEISRRAEALADRFRETRGSLDVINRNMEELDEVSEIQSEKIVETSAALKQMAASVSQVTAVINQRQQTVAALKESAEGGASDIARTEESFQKLSSQMESVNSLIGLILDVTDRINLLAMNAAIEAARAGSAGKGFAVVAQEIRGLAEASTQNAKKIEETLTELKAAVSESGRDISESGTSFRSISSSVGEVAEAMQEIRQGMFELSGGSEEILSATNTLVEMSSKVESAVSRTGEQEKEAGRALLHLEEFVEGLIDSISAIKGDTLEINESSAKLRERCNIINSFVKDFSRRTGAAG